MATVLLVLVVVLVIAALVFGVVTLLSGDDAGLSAVEPDGRALPLPNNRSLSELDLKAVRFDVELRGYRMSQVDRVLRRTAYDVGYKDEMIAVLEAEVAALRDGRIEDAELLRKARESAASPVVTPTPAAYRVTESEDFAAARADDEFDDENLGDDNLDHDSFDDGGFDDDVDGDDQLGEEDQSRRADQSGGAHRVGGDVGEYVGHDVGLDVAPGRLARRIGESDQNTEPERAPSARDQTDRDKVERDKVERDKTERDKTDVEDVDHRETEERLDSDRDPALTQDPPRDPTGDEDITSQRASRG